MTMQTQQTEHIALADPKIAKVEAELARLDEAATDAEAEATRAAIVAAREPTEAAVVNELVMTKRAARARELANTKRAELAELLAAKLDAERKRNGLAVFVQVDPETHVRQHTARAKEIIRSTAVGLTTELGAMAAGAAAYMLALPRLNELGISAPPLTLAPEVDEIVKSLADLNGPDRSCTFSYVNANPGFWEIRITIPAGQMNQRVKP